MKLHRQNALEQHRVHLRKQIISKDPQIGADLNTVAPAHKAATTDHDQKNLACFQTKGEPSGLTETLPHQ